MRTFAEFFAALQDLASFATTWWRQGMDRLSTYERVFILASLVLTLSSTFAFSHWISQARLQTVIPSSYSPSSSRPAQKKSTASQNSWTPPDIFKPVRPIPATFRANSKLPAIREGVASGSIHLFPFDPARDLIRVEDSRVWWESDHDDHTGDTEDDHLMHWAMEEPFRRLVELLQQKHPKGVLKVQDAYRPTGIHGLHSLHKQGRALDLTGNNIPLSEIARLAYASGFDWVYYETTGGAHIHASVSPRGKIRPPPGTSFLTHKR